MPVRGSEGRHAKPWELLADMGEASPSREVVDEFTGDSQRFHERHYNEFVTFLPYVQRFLYGEGRSQKGGSATGSPMRVFRRSDVSAVRAVLHPGAAPITLDIVHVDLYFFLDLDLVLLNVEVSARDLALPQAQELLYRFGRGYPAGWDADGHAQHCLFSAEWLDAAGQVIPYSNTKALGKLLYTEYLFPVEVAAVILLVAMISAIALTLRQRKDSKAINPAAQIRVRAADRLAVLKMAPTQKPVADLPAEPVVEEKKQ